MSESCGKQRAAMRECGGRVSLRPTGALPSEVADDGAVHVGEKEVSLPAREACEKSRMVDDGAVLQGQVRQK